jgi:hypothetical protein
MFVLAGILRKNQIIVDIRGTKFIQIRKKHEINILLKDAVAGAVALQGFASSPEHTATHAPL